MIQGMQRRQGGEGHVGVVLFFGHWVSRENKLREGRKRGQVGDLEPMVRYAWNIAHCSILAKKVVK